jgi:hypothetical protein
LKGIYGESKTSKLIIRNTSLFFIKPVTKSVTGFLVQLITFFYSAKRNNSLIPILPRVLASTFFTMIAA